MDKLFKLSRVIGCAALLTAAASCQTQWSVFRKKESKVISKKTQERDIYTMVAVAQNRPEELNKESLDFLFLIAEGFLLSGDTEKAALFFEQIFVRAPSYPVGLKLAKLLLTNRKTQKAERLLQKLSTLYPNQTDHHIFLAEVQLIQGHTEQSTKTLKNAYAINPGKEIIAEQYLMNLVVTKQLKEAKQVLEQALKSQPASPRLFLVSARIAFQENNFDLAFTESQRVTREEPDLLDGWVLAGLAASKLGRIEDALTYFQEAFSRHPENLAVAREYIDLLHAQDRFYDELTVLQRIENLQRTDLRPEFKARLAQILFHLEKFNEAKPYFENLLAQETDEGRKEQYHLFLAFCSDSLGETKAAISHYKEVHTQGDRKNLAMKSLLNLYVKTKDWANAESTLRQYRKENPTQPEHATFFLLGLLELGKMEEARSVALQFQAEYPQDPSVQMLSISIAYYDDPYHPEAIKRIRELLQKNPTNSNILNHLGYLLLGMPQPDLAESQTLIEKALSKEPQNLFFKDSLAWNMFLQKQYQKAESLLEEVVQNLNEELIIIYHFAEVKKAVGRVSEAKSLMEQAARLLKTRKTELKPLDPEEKMVESLIPKVLKELDALLQSSKG